MRINHNLTAINTHRQLGINMLSAAKSMEKLSSGLRINRAGDDAAGLAISEKMRSQVRGLEQASRNSQDGISLIQTAEGALNETHDILQRIRELAIQSSNDTNTDADRAQLQKETAELITEIDRIGSSTEFNTQKVLDGPQTFDIQVGANQGQTISLSWNGARSNALGDDGTGATVDISLIDISTKGGATSAITTLDNAIEAVSNVRSDMGAFQNRIEHSINNLNTSSENLQAAESRIRDVDIAKEMMEFTKKNILNQAAQAMLSHANQQSQGILQLLR